MSSCMQVRAREKSIMVQVTESAQIADAIRQVRQGSAGFVTNFFAGRKQIETWTNLGLLSCQAAGRCVWIRRQDRDFYHLYYFAVDAQTVEDALGELDQVADRAPLVIDLVGRKNDVPGIAEVFRRHGFEEHALLVRLTRPGGPCPASDGEDPEVSLAETADAPEILGLLDRLFEPFSKQIPGLSEIRDAISRNGILIVRRRATLAGLLFYETAGITSTLRYWCVDESFRDQGVGAKLIKTFFRNCRDSRSVVLWVYAGNDNAIRRYRQYGFQETDTVDRILIRR
jgi:ribosomal protein S18 acetylase RimI-like enzyme